MEKPAISLHDPKPEIPALTGLRCIAAFGIMYAHVFWYALRSRTDGKMQEGLVLDTASFANACMPLFFVLSGFVIHYNYAHSIKMPGWTGIKKFFIARLARLYPLYLLCLGLDMAEGNFPLGHKPTLPIILSLLTMTQSWTLIEIKGIQLSHAYFVIAWSISVEVFLYLLYIPLIKFRLLPRSLKGARKATIVALIVTCTLFAILRCDFFNILGAPSSHFFIFQPFTRFPEFLLGVYAAEIIRHEYRLGVLECKEANPYRLLGWMGLALTVFAFASGDFIKLSFAYAPGMMCIILHVSTSKGMLTRLLESGPMLALGEASYSLYLLHGYFNILVPGFGGWASFAYKTTIIFSLDIIVALGTYRVYEVPMRSVVRRVLYSRLITEEQKTPVT